MIVIVSGFPGLGQQYQEIRVLAVEMGRYNLLYLIYYDWTEVIKMTDFLEGGCLLSIRYYTFISPFTSPLINKRNPVLLQEPLNWALF